MARTPQPRFITDLQVAIEISAADETEAAERLAAVQDFIADRLARSTFTRLAGQPKLTYVDVPGDVTPA